LKEDGGGSDTSSGKMTTTSQK